MSKIEEKSLDENAVTANAKPADPMPKSEAGTPGQAGYQDLGGPTPMNSKPDDDSNKYKTGGGPTATPPQTKPSDASGKTVDSMKGDVKAGHEPEGDVIAEDEAQKEEEVIEVDLSADVQALTEGEDLSEEFKEKAKTIFEAAVVTRLNEELGRMHDEYAKVLEEEIEKVKSDLAEKVDDYLSYSVKNWMDTNSLAIEHGIKNEMAENVLDGIKKVFVENHIELPEEKLYLVDEMTSQLDQMETIEEDDESFSFEIVHKNNLLNIFFDKVSNKIIGWTTTDIYLNKVETRLSNVETNIMIDEKIFRVQNYIN